jgi:nucleoside-diphosphate-sugar epimerase
MRALVTGASGYVGGSIARRLLARGDTVHAILRASSDAAALPAGITLHRHDGSIGGMQAIVAAAAPEVTFHLASLFIAEHKPVEIAPMISANLAFGTMLADALTASGPALLVNAGTGWQHYGGADYDPVCLYAATKQAFEALLTFYVEARGLRAVTLKIFDTYGPDDPRPKLMSALIKAAKAGTPLDLTAGDQRMDFLHIDDAVAAFLAAAERLRAGKVAAMERYALSSGRKVSVKELAAIVEQAAGKKLATRWGARSYRRREVMEPWSGGAALPGWQAAIPLETGIADLVRRA